MSIFKWIHDSEESYEQGCNWAEKILISGEIVDWKQVSYLAEEYGKDSDAFYKGFREIWNGYIAYEKKSK